MKKRGLTETTLKALLTFFIVSSVGLFSYTGYKIISEKINSELIDQSNFQIISAVKPSYSQTKGSIIIYNTGNFTITGLRIIGLNTDEEFVITSKDIPQTIFQEGGKISIKQNETKLLNIKFPSTVWSKLNKIKIIPTFLLPAIGELELEEKTIEKILTEPDPTCNLNSFCESFLGETIQNCPEDCFKEPPPRENITGECDNDGICETGETFESCPNDCPPSPLCTPGEVRECGTDVGVCQKGNQTCQENGYWGECKNEIKPQNEICNDTLDNDCDNQTDEGCDNQTDEGFILSYYGRFIDAEPWYEKYLPTYIQLQNLGFTHAGIHIWRQSSDISERIQSLRDNGIPIMLHQQTGHYFLLPGTNQPGGDGEEMLDPEEHTSNGQNLKYYDFLNFNASECNRECGSSENPNCNIHPSYRALDPSYNGVVWQKEISYLKNAVQQAELGPGDIVAMDNELWSLNPTFVDVCYSGAFMQDSGKYFGSTLDERYEEYYNYWLQRGIDMTNAVKEIDPQIGVYHHHENTYKLARGMFYGDTNWYLASTGMPYGSGDAPSPSFYAFSNLTEFREQLDQDDFSGTVVWISFSYSAHTPKYPWDPKITQKVGYWLRQEGVKGIIEFPGPYGHNIPIDYYMAHAQALLKGFLENEDPGEI